MRQEIIIGTERRRRWSDEEKLSILREVGADGASATQVARRHDIGRPQIYRWRRDLRRKGLWPDPPEAVFLTLDGPVEPAKEKVLPAELRAPSAEIVLLNGRQLRLRGGMDDADIARLIRVAETA